MYNSFVKPLIRLKKLGNSPSSPVRNDLLYDGEQNVGETTRGRNDRKQSKRSGRGGTPYKITKQGGSACPNGEPLSGFWFMKG